jgi:hypothetical protein
MAQLAFEEFEEQILLRSDPVIGATAGATGTGAAAIRTGDVVPLVTMHMVWTIPGGLTWLFIVGCAAAGWVVGFGMGYRRGVKDAIHGDIAKADHRLRGE